jgi:hypothetical protein
VALGSAALAVPTVAAGELMGGDMREPITNDERAIATLKEVVGTLITWMAQSANSPIRTDEAEKLLTILRRDDDVNFRKG